MSYFDDASLVMIPSGYKDQKVYSVKPIDGTGDLTFSRGSDIEATRVASNGYIEKAKVNLLLQSNTFSTTWTNINSTETGGQAGYDGSSDAWLLEKSDVNARISQPVSQSGVQTLSVYAKKGDSDYLRLYVDGPTANIYFDLTDGSIQSSSSIISGKSTDMGGGWYRCEVAFEGSSTFVRIYPAEAGTTAGATGSIYIQDAQLNYGLVAQEYVETTTTSVVAGITNDMPRLDYSGGASCPSLLLEPSRTNLVSDSEYFGGYSKTNISVEDNFITSPEGVQNAAKLIESSDASASSHYVNGDNFSVVTNTIYTFSVFAKSNGRGIQVRAQNASGNFAYVYVNYDLTLGVVDANAEGNAEYVDSDIQDYGNGWYRCILQMKYTDAGNTLGRFSAFTYNESTNNHSYVGDGTSGIYIYGAQVEAGSYPTSYIPTYGTSATRTADACSKTGISSLIGQTEGTLFFECTSKALLNQARYFILSDGTFNNRIDIYQYSDTQLGVYVAAGGVAQVAGQYVTLPSSGSFKFAVGYANNDYVWYLNVSQIGTDTTGSVPTLSNALFALDAAGNASGGSGNSPFKQALLFKTRLSNSDLATLTSL